jgi:tetratricopeptide (TPR) repeat protein
LLNTDWYTDGLKRQAYDSKPVDFSMTPDKYKQGTRDYVVYFENPELERRYGINKTDYYPLKNIMAFINDDKDPMGTVATQGGESLRYFPTKKFSLIIDKDACLKNGVVQPEDAAMMVDTIKWEIGNNNLMKADLVLLDIITTNINTRPIYWAITTGSDVYLNLTNYFQLEGLTYRLVPLVSNVQRDGTTGRINSNILYKNLMEKFKWGNMEAEDTYLDETILRQTKNFRNIFYRLSEQLTMEGRKDSAVKAIDYCLQVMPNNKVTYDVFVVRLVEAYHMAGATDKANKLAEELLAIHEEKAKYFAGFKAKRNSVRQDFDDNMQIMNYIWQVTDFNKQTKLAADFRKRIDAIQPGM